MDVCLYANIRIFKQITTCWRCSRWPPKMFVSMQIYEFLSKSQHEGSRQLRPQDVCLYANIRIFKQITTRSSRKAKLSMMFVSMQIYEFLSKSQQDSTAQIIAGRCLSLCKYTNF